MRTYPCEFHQVNSIGVCRVCAQREAEAKRICGKRIRTMSWPDPTQVDEWICTLLPHNDEAHKFEAALSAIEPKPIEREPNSTHPVTADRFSRRPA